MRRDRFCSGFRLVEVVAVVVGVVGGEVAIVVVVVGISVVVVVVEVVVGVEVF